MQIATESAVQPLPSPEHPTPDLEVLPLEGTYADHKVIRRNGAVVGFEPAKIAIALTKAFIAVNGGTGAASARVREQVAQLSSAVVKALVRRQPIICQGCSAPKSRCVTARWTARFRPI